MVEIGFISPSLTWESGILIKVLALAGLSIPGQVTFLCVLGTVLGAGAKALHTTGKVAILRDLD